MPKPSRPPPRARAGSPTNLCLKVCGDLGRRHDSLSHLEDHFDGFFDLLARRNKAWAEWRDADAETLTAIINERVEREKRSKATTPLPDQRTAA